MQRTQNYFAVADNIFLTYWKPAFILLGICIVVMWILAVFFPGYFPMVR